MRFKVLVSVSVLILLGGVGAGIQNPESALDPGVITAHSGSLATSASLSGAAVDLPIRPAEAKRTKRMGEGSVRGVAGLRRDATKYAKSKTLRILKIHSQDGSDAGLTGATVTKVKAGNVEQVIKKAEADNTVIEIGIDRKVKAFDMSETGFPGGGHYWQWALEALNVEEAWADATGVGVKVAVLDTGVQANHPDLEGQVLDGYDFVDPESGTNGGDDPNGHGTHVAGIVAALAGPLGTTGLAYDTKIIPMRVLNEDGNGYNSDVVNGIIKATDLGADVINMSLGGVSNDFESAVNYARNLGVSVVASNGNAGEWGSPLSYPANTAGVIGVGAPKSDDTRASYSRN